MAGRAVRPSQAAGRVSGLSRCQRWPQPTRGWCTPRPPSAVCWGHTFARTKLGVLSVLETQLPLESWTSSETRSTSECQARQAGSSVGPWALWVGLRGEVSEPRGVGGHADETQRVCGQIGRGCEGISSEDGRAEGGGFL